MKKTISILAMLMIILSMTVLAKPVTKNEYTELHDIDGDGILDNVVVVEETLKDTKKTSVIQKSYFAEDYLEYLGQELIVDGEVIVDTFTPNN